MDMVIPTIGASGTFNLRAPFDSKILNSERYTCQAVRRLSEYLANNETPKEDIYLANGLTANQYDEDLEKDIFVVSLQAANGHWLTVPANYIIQLPLVNGIPYRSMMIGVALPPMPADKDFSNLETSIRNLVMDTIGVTCTTKVVETSMVSLISYEQHEIKQTQRDAAAVNNLTDRSKHMKALQDIASLQQKILLLESYIEQNNI
jgi:hypothetical protein